jgi:hypothetical protein
MAASRMISHPFASHAAGTVNQTSAESARWHQDNHLPYLTDGRHTQVSNSTDLPGNLLFGIFPQAAQEIDNKINSFLSNLLELNVIAGSNQKVSSTNR